MAENGFNFILMGGTCCYALGGFRDYIGSFATLEDATSAAAVESDEGDAEWWHVWSLADGKIVARSETEAYDG